MIKFFVPPESIKKQQFNFNLVKIVHLSFDSIENIVGKGEKSGYHHFLLKPQSSHETSFLGCLKTGTVSYSVNYPLQMPSILAYLRFRFAVKSELFTTQSRLLTTSEKKTFENIVGKGENAGNQHFLLFPQCFLPVPKQISIFQSHLFCRLQMLSIWT